MLREPESLIEFIYLVLVTFLAVFLLLWGVDSAMNLRGDPWLSATHVAEGASGTEVEHSAAAEEPQLEPFVSWWHLAGATVWYANGDRDRLI